MLKPYDFTANTLITPGISNTISRAEPSGYYDELGFYHNARLADLFPNATYPNTFTSVLPFFKIDDQIVFFYFDEPMLAGKGNIVISSNTDTRNINVNDTNQVAFGSGGYIPHNPLLQNGEHKFGVVTINLSADLLLDTVYTIQVSDGVFVDSIGNPQAGFDDASFKTIDSDPLYYVSYKADFSVDGDFYLYFDETVQAGTGNIVIRNIGNDADSRIIAINDVSQVTFDSDMVTIDPTDDLLPDSVYTIQIGRGVITDEAGHPNAAISDPANKTAAATPQPVLISSNPANGSSDFKADADIELHFNEAVRAGTGNLVLSNGIDTRKIALDDKNQVTFDGHNVTINPTEDLIPGTTYTAQMASGVITDKENNPYSGFTDASFSTIDPGPHLWVESGHRFDNVKIDQNFNLFFDEEVVAGSGNIIISNGSDIRTIDIKDTSQVIFDKNHFLIINPTADLIPDTTYSVQISNTGITDTKGNALAGVDNQVFLATIDSAPLFVGSYPNNGEGIKSDQPIVLRFDEKIIAGSGELFLSNGTDTRSIAINDGSQVIFSGRSVIIDLKENLVPDTIYTAQMASGVIADSEGNPYRGFTDASFTVTDTSPITTTGISESNAIAI